MALPPRGNRMPPPFAAYVLPTESTLSVYILPPIFIVAEVSCLRRSKGSPTEYADLTEVFAENILPQISLLLRIFSHRFHRIHRTSCCVYSPTDFTDLHRWLGCVDSSGGILASAASKCLPQISQNSQNFLLSVFSHRFHRIHRTSCRVYSPTDFTDLHRWLGCLQGGALVSSAPTEQEVHQPSKIDILPRNPQNSQNFLQSVFSHRFHRFTQMVRVPSRGCTCLKCTNQARSTPM